MKLSELVQVLSDLNTSYPESVDPEVQLWTVSTDATVSSVRATFGDKPSVEICSS